MFDELLHPLREKKYKSVLLFKKSNKYTSTSKPKPTIMKSYTNLGCNIPLKQTFNIKCRF